MSKAKPAAKPPARGIGRPSSYTDMIAAEICTRIAVGESLRSICKRDTMPSFATVMRWLADEKHAEFRDQYARAHEAQADYLADEIIEIADEKVKTAAEVNRNRLRVDARKWVASKLRPKKYGDKLDLQHSGGLTLSQLVEKSFGS